MMLPSPYPSAFNTPICVRCSSTIRFMVVIHTSAATRKKNTGKTFAMPSTIPESLSKHTYPTFVYLSSTYAVGSSNSSIAFSPSEICSLASAIAVSYSVTPFSYSFFPSAYFSFASASPASFSFSSFCPSASCFFASASAASPSLTCCFAASICFLPSAICSLICASAAVGLDISIPSKKAPIPSASLPRDVPSAAILSAEMLSPASTLETSTPIAISTWSNCASFSEIFVFASASSCSFAASSSGAVSSCFFASESCFSPSEICSFASSNCCLAPENFSSASCCFSESSFFPSESCFFASANTVS